MFLSAATIWAITLLFEKPLLFAGLNLPLVIPGVLEANEPLRVVYPYCLQWVFGFLHDFTAKGVSADFDLLSFLPCAILIIALVRTVAIKQFGKKEIRCSRRFFGRCRKGWRDQILFIYCFLAENVLYYVRSFAGSGLQVLRCQKAVR